MEKNKSKKKFGKASRALTSCSTLMMSAAQAVVKIDMQHTRENHVVAHHLLRKDCLSDNYYTWEDLFNDATKVDPTMSYNYEIAGGFVKMKNTYPLWTDPAWTRMKPITMTAIHGH